MGLNYSKVKPEPEDNSFEAAHARRVSEAFLRYKSQTPAVEKQQAVVRNSFLGEQQQAYAKFKARNNTRKGGKKSRKFRKSRKSRKSKRTKQ